MKVDPELSTLAPPTRYSDCSREEKGPQKKKSTFRSQGAYYLWLGVSSDWEPQAHFGEFRKAAFGLGFEGFRV